MNLPSSSAQPSSGSAGSLGSGTGDRKNYIGCVLSLISKSQIRYVGTLVHINSQEQTLTLQHVKSYGSEGRRGEEQEIPPSEEVYEYIIFRAADLLDFYVIRSPEFKDPAIISSETKNKSPQFPSGDPPPGSQNPPGTQSISSNPIVAPQNQPPVKPNEEEKVLSSPPQNKQEFKEEDNFSGPKRYRQFEGRGGRYYNRQNYGGFLRRQGYFRGGNQNYRGRGSYYNKKAFGELNENPDEEVKEKYKEDFNFEKMNDKFEKLFIGQNEQPIEDSPPKYDKKKSFFDNISSSVSEKKEIEDPDARAKQFNIDVETFGASRRPYYRNYRGRGGFQRGPRQNRGFQYRGEYRGGYRGLYRGDNRGEYRGTYNNRYQSGYQPRRYRPLYRRGEYRPRGGNQGSPEESSLEF